MNSGTLIISLDFELFWGMQDVQPLDEYRSNILGAKSVIEAMLAMFSDYSIHATWASVGFLFAKNIEQLKEYLPASELWPTYDNHKCKSYRCLDWIENDPNLSKYFLAPELVDKIIQSEHQELATHTLSHFYCKEPGQKTDQFRADLTGARIIADKLKNTDVKTLVFPRNQCVKAYVDILGDLGIVAYRGEEEDWIHARIDQSGIMRVFRLLDSYVSLTGHGCYNPKKVPGQVLNLKGSRFLRPYNKKLAAFEKLKLRRIKKQMLHAAQNGQIFHLWWHPHNFGDRQEYHMGYLREILEYYKVLSEKYNMRSLNMLECAQELG